MDLVTVTVVAVVNVVAVVDQVVLVVEIESNPRSINGIIVEDGLWLPGSVNNKGGIPVLVLVMTDRTDRNEVIDVCSCACVSGSGSTWSCQTLGRLNNRATAGAIIPPRLQPSTNTAEVKGVRAAHANFAGCGSYVVVADGAGTNKHS